MIKENICSYHEYIKERSRKIKKLDMTKIITLEDALLKLEETKQYATEIYDYAKLAKTAGIHMENRLSIYKEGVESMGFVRKKGNRKKHDK